MEDNNNGIKSDSVIVEQKQSNDVQKNVNEHMKENAQGTKVKTDVKSIVMYIFMMLVIVVCTVLLINFCEKSVNDFNSTFNTTTVLDYGLVSKEPVSTEAIMIITTTRLQTGATHTVYVTKPSSGNNGNTTIPVYDYIHITKSTVPKTSSSTTTTTSTTTSTTTTTTSSTTTTEEVTEPTTNEIKELDAIGSIAVTMECTNDGCGNYVLFQIDAIGGTGPYVYKMDVYKDGVSKGRINYNKGTLPYASGNYKMEYEVTDSAGNKINKSVTVTIS